MDTRSFSRENHREIKSSVSLQKKLAESRRPNKAEHAPDITDFMNDMFFGTVNADKKAYNLTGGRLIDEEEDFDDSTRSNSSRMTQEWLEEARRMVASSPSRCDSPSRHVGLPRFAAVPGRHSSASAIDRRDPLSRSARRHRTMEGFSGEILTKSAKHSRNVSETLDTSNTLTEPSPAVAVQKWFSNVLKPSNSTPTPDPATPYQSNDPPISSFDQTGPTLPPRLSIHRRSRFQTEPPVPSPQGIPVPARRTFKPAPLPADTQLLSPPKHLIESAHRRSISSSTCSMPENHALSPPRNIVESAHRRSISKSHCFVEKIGPESNANGWQKEEGEGERDLSLNEFLKEQRIKIENIQNGVFDSKAKIVLSDPSNSTSSMVAAICYAWLLENRVRKSKGESARDGDGYVVVPVMNVRRGRMWKQRQAAWLFHHVGVDATSLLFADEVDLEGLMMAGQLSILIVGQDVLRTNGEVGSQCTILTDNYCEDAYDLLQTPVLKKLLLAGILQDTHNLNASVKSSMTRDAEAVQLLLVGSAPNYRNALFDQLMQDHRDNGFFEALRHNYGKPPTESNLGRGTLVDHRVPGRNSTSVSQYEVKNSEKNSNDLRNAKADRDSQKSAKPNALPAHEGAQKQTASDASRGKNKSFLARWFGFGSKGR